MDVRDYRSLAELLDETVSAHPEKIAYRWILEPGELGSVTWAGFRDQVRQASRALLALGIAKDEKVSILSYTRYQWVLMDFAVASIGACTVGIYQTLLAKDCRYIIEHSDSVLVFAEDPQQLAKLREIRDRIPNVRRVVLFEGDVGGDDWVLSWNEFLALAEDTPEEEVERRSAEVESGDAAAIVYTSGTTGVPKGAVLSHDNFTFTVQSAEACLPTAPGDDTILFLPLAHVFARIIVCMAVKTAATLTFARSLDTLAEDIRIARPHYFASVPRVYEKVYSRVISGAEAKGGLSLSIFRWAVKVGRKVSDLKVAKRSIPPLLAFQYAVANKLVFSKVQEALGGRLRFCISGAAPLNADIARFFHGAGVLILEGIGMTENTSFTNVNRYDDYRFGWVGPPGPGIEQRTSEEGEVMYRGRNVMKEYYKMPEETAETLTSDGWQLTGDLGEIDDRGFLRITGRKKDLIITAGGKNVAPVAIEGLIATSKYIQQACVVGDRRKYLSALVVLDPENIQEYAREHQISFDDPKELERHPEILELVENEIQTRNADLASFETIKKFRVVDEFTIENGMLTPTMKIKRNVAIDRYSDTIESMYQEA